MQHVEPGAVGLRLVIGAALTAFSVYFNALAVPLIVLAIMMILDYITGMTAAWKQKTLNSKKGVEGIIKKIGYMVLVAVAMGVDFLVMSGLRSFDITIQIDMIFGLLVPIWLIINEMISILENLSIIDVPIPDFLKKIIKKLKITAEATGDPVKDKEEIKENKEGDNKNG